jgi:hypothetical protein
MALFMSGSRNVDNVMVIVWAAVVLPPLKTPFGYGAGLAVQLPTQRVSSPFSPFPFLLLTQLSA